MSQKLTMSLAIAAALCTIGLFSLMWKEEVRGKPKPPVVTFITVFDPKARWKVDPTTFLSKGRNTPYVGMTLVGRAACTIVAGSVVYQTTLPVHGREQMNRVRG